jgi:hypothetical protein
VHNGRYEKLFITAISRRSGFISKPAAQPGLFSKSAIQSVPLIGATNFVYLDFGCAE